MMKRDIGYASSLLREGKNASRESWGGGWITYMPAVKIPYQMINARTLSSVPPATDLQLADYIAFTNSAGERTCGWVPTTADLLADDWLEVTP